MRASVIFESIDFVRFQIDDVRVRTRYLNHTALTFGKQYSLLVENGVLNYANKFVDAPDATLTLTKDTLDNIQLKQITMDQAIESGAIKIDGNKEAFTDFLALLDTYPFWFNIVTP
jgi:alkyl sulfatase BDS1-like metallo-beta-lactamase superfamily hydrolase